MSKAQRLALILFAAGMVIRILLIPTPSGSDVVSYAKWGHNVYTQGLAESFDGVYFPIQYLLLSATHFFSAHLNITFDYVNKAFNLAFEVGLLALMISLTKKTIQPWKTMAIYWLNPFTLIIFQQGYIDSQFSFFVVLSVWVLLTQTHRRRYVLTSLSLGVALLMKPQALPIMVVLGLLGMILLVARDGGWKKAFFIFSAPALLLLIFSVYFGFALDLTGHKTLGSISGRIQSLGVSPATSDVLAGSTFLPAHYAHVPDIMPAVNANMPGPWFFVAQSLRTNGQPIYRVSDKISFAGISLRELGLALFLLISGLFAYKISRSSRTIEEKIALVILFVPLLVPYLTTSAHESHFYLGFATGFVLFAWLGNRTAIRCVYALGALSGLNMILLYIVPKYYHIAYSIRLQSAIVAISTAAFLILMHQTNRMLTSLGHTATDHYEI
jgi:hypothetical protein